MIILNNKAYYREEDKLECYYPYGTQSTSVIYVPYSADDRDFDPGNYIDENMLLEFDESEYTVADYGTWGFYTIQGVDKKWRILQLDMKWVLPEGIASKSRAIINALKPFLDYEKILKVLNNESDHKEHVNAVTKALRNAIQSDSSTGKRVKVKKIMIDYPAYIYHNDQTARFAKYARADGYYNYPFKAYDPETDKCIGVDGYSGSGSSWRPQIPDENAQYELTKTGNGYINPSVLHTRCVYPDDDYWSNDFTDLTTWLTWLNDNRHKIAYAKPMNIPTEINSLQDLRLRCYPEVYEARLNNLIAYVKAMDERTNYGFGILLENRPDHTDTTEVYPYDRATSIALYSGKYYKITKNIEMDTLKDTWFDLTYSAHKHVTGGAYYIGWNLYDTYNEGLTIGFLDAITESEFLSNPPVILITAAPTNKYNDYVNQQAPLGLKKLNKEPLTYVRDQGGYHFASTWNIYSEIVLPYDLFHIKGNNTELYHTYAFGEKLKYRKRFVSSPVFTFPLFTGYFSHGLRPLEGLVPGREK